MRRIVCICAAIFCLSPLAVHAEQKQEWKFGDPEALREWTVSNIELQQQTNQGIIMSSKQNGIVVRELNHKTPVDVIQIIFASNKPIAGSIVWFPEAGNTPYKQFPFTLPTAPKGSLFQFSTEVIEDWDRTPHRIGIAFPNVNDTLLLSSIGLIHYSTFEKLKAGFASVLQFDAYKPYTVNFIWGPQLFRLPASMQGLFGAMPPPIKSVNEPLYKLLILALVIGAILWFWKRYDHTFHKRIVYSILGGILVLWIAYDLRMGIEFLSYVRADYKQYIAPAVEEKTFRDRGDFHKFVNDVLPFIKDDATYVFLTQRNWPYLGNMRYLTYPTVPKEIETDNGSRHWVVYNQPGLSQGPEGELILDGETISPPGQVIYKLSNQSFLFRTY